MTWNCYILKLANSGRSTFYIGMTNNLKKRLRQHNGEIKGGARFTSRYLKKGFTWEFCAIISGLPDKINCLQCEWRLKHPDNHRRRPRRYNSIPGIITGCGEVLRDTRWTRNSSVANSEMNLKVYIHRDYCSEIGYLPENMEGDELENCELIK